MRALTRHLYFHIPFCPKLCPYCSFYVEVGGKNKTYRFLDALLREVEQSAPRLQPRTLYFGGGTPSALSCGQLEYLFRGLAGRLDLTALEESTLEANPATIGVEKAQLLRTAGVTRLSLGVQSWDDSLLKTLGRVHNAEQAEKTFVLLRNAGFDNMNIDLMFGVPGQTIAQWRASLERTIALRPEHISCYGLTYEEDTEYFRELQSGHFVQDEEREIRLFEMTMDALTAAGYGHYEISNFARSGFECRHNKAYWRGADYLGFGPSAFSTIGRRRWQNVPDTAEYTRRMLSGEAAASFEEALTTKVRRGEKLAFGMRTRRGLAAATLQPWVQELREFEELGLIEHIGKRIVLTRRGKLMADAVGATFVAV